MLAQACRGKKTSLKAALSDQRIVAGLGNIYVCEALHRARLSPKRRASTIATRTGAPNDHAARLVEGIRVVLNDAIKAGGSSLRDHRLTDGALGMFQHNFRVYDREGERCVTPGCKGTIKRIVQTGRSTFFCPVSEVIDLGKLKARRPAPLTTSTQMNVVSFHEKASCRFLQKGAPASTTWLGGPGIPWFSTAIEITGGNLRAGRDHLTLGGIADTAARERQIGRKP